MPTASDAALVAATAAAVIAAIASAPEIATVSILVVAWDVAGAIADWWDNGPGARELIADQLNKRLAAAGLDIQFPPFNPLTEDGRAVFKKTIEAYTLDRLNAKAGTGFSKISELTPDSFLVEVGRVVAGEVNNQTGAKLTAIFPIEKLKDQLHSEVLRQFDNRGRYAPGALFAPGVMDDIKGKVAAKYPALMQQVAAQIPGGMWGPPVDQKHAIRREKARIRQDKYRRTHQQVWAKK